MGRHSSTTPPDAYPARPDHPEQGRGRADAPAYAPADDEAPLDQGALLAGPAAPPPSTTIGKVQPTDAEPSGWPGQLADHPFGREAATAAEPARPRREDPTEPTGIVQHEGRTPAGVEQAEEEHLDWLRHLPERRDEVPAERPAAHGRADPPPPRETPRREWTERLVVGLIAGLVTFAATRWAGAGWSTAAGIGVTVLVVVPAAAWVATLGDRSQGPQRPEH